MGDINAIPAFIDASGVATFQATSVNRNSPFDSNPFFIVPNDEGFDADADAFLLGTLVLTLSDSVKLLLHCKQLMIVLSLDQQVS